MGVRTNLGFGRRDAFVRKLYAPWDSSSTAFGNFVVLTFVIVQFLDGGLTYVGVTEWGPSVEANPLLSYAMVNAGVGTSLATAKLVAIGFGIVLHLCRVHTLVALLTAFYVAAAIVPWTALFLST